MRVRVSCVTCVRVYVTQAGRHTRASERAYGRMGVRRAGMGVRACDRQVGRWAGGPVGKAKKSEDIFRNGDPP